MKHAKRIIIRITALCLLIGLAACQSGYQSSKSTKKSPTKTASPAKTTKPSSDNKSLGNSYTVQSGDTLYGISFRAGLNYRDVAAWNDIDEAYTIKIGQKLRLTAPGSAPASSAAVKGSLAPLPNVKPTLSNPVRVEPAVMPAASSIAWQWPTKGEIAGTFIADDKTNQGIDIAGKSGQKILASADGVVVYSGAGLIGYGELLIIKHNSEWISAYAHNSKRLVAEGVKVKAGQHIADMGHTGAVRDMLHFEIRRNGKPVDPLLYLPRP